MQIVLPIHIYLPEGTREGKKRNFVHFRIFIFLCSIAGTFGAVLTCPLEVIKTRYQSSQTAFSQGNTELYLKSSVSNSTAHSSASARIQRPTIIGSLR